jgi:hypothetical protein
LSLPAISRVVYVRVVGYAGKKARRRLVMKKTPSERYTIERAYRDVFGVCQPSITDFPKDAIYPLGLNALMRGTPVTREELQAWMAQNPSSVTP